MTNEELRELKRKEEAEGKKIKDIVMLLLRTSGITVFDMDKVTTDELEAVIKGDDGYSTGQQEAE